MRYSEHGSVNATDFAEAHFILIDIKEGVFALSDITADYFGVSVRVRLIRGLGSTGVYLDLRQTLVCNDASISALVAAHFSRFQFYYNDPTHIENILLYLDQLKVERQELNGVTQLHHNEKTLVDLEKTKISGDHHIHYTAVEIWNTLNSEEQSRAKLAFTLPKNISTTFMAGVLLWLATLDEELVVFIKATGLLASRSQEEFAKIGKAISVRAKSLQNLNQMDLRPLFEIDVLINRYLGDPIWEQEKENRTNPRLAEVTPGTVYKIAYGLFSKPDKHRAKPRNFAWNTFWKARWQWSATGSVHSQYYEDSQYIEKDRELKNKFITLNEMPTFPIDKFLKRKPEIRAWSSIKYEWAKLRAIYGTDLTSYILTHFAFFNCEDTLPMDFPVGEKARPSFVSARVDATLHGREAFCLDFEDFNSQHSNENMAMVLKAWLDCNESKLSEDQVKAGRWAIESISNTIIEDNIGTGTTYKSNGTLMSGWRMTTFVNSVLNYVYTQVLLSGQTTDVRSIHNGDDVLLGLKTPSVINLMMSNAKKYNIRVQSSKCAYGGIAEFLRVDHRRGDFGQYVTRSIATLMHARIESKVAITISDYVEAVEARFFDFVMRTKNYDLAARCRETYYDRLSYLYSIEPELLYELKTTHRVCGGISEKRNAKTNTLFEFEAPEKIVPLPDHLPGVADYSTKLRDDLELQVDEGKLYDRIYNATLNAVQLVRKELKTSDVRGIRQYKVLRGLYGAYRHLRDNSVLGKAMLTGFAFDILSKHPSFEIMALVASASSDPLLYIKTVC